jgi:hypothetical protein
MARYRLHYFPESGNSYKLARMAGLPGWKAPYDLLPGQRLRCYV